MKHVSADEMRHIEKIANDLYGIPTLLLMEHAGKGIADLIESKFAKASVLVISGKGNNGGDGMVAARHLWNHGLDVQLALAADPLELKDDRALNWRILQKMKIPTWDLTKDSDMKRLKEQIKSRDLVVDALLGTGIAREVEGPYRRLIQEMNESHKTILAVDVPSGLHADSGLPMGVAVKASLTATLGLAKQGLFVGKGPEFSGQIHLIDIGLPRSILDTRGCF